MAPRGKEPRPLVDILIAHVRTFRLDGRMDRYYLSETVKYLFLQISSFKQPEFIIATENVPVPTRASD